MQPANFFKLDAQTKTIEQLKREHSEEVAKRINVEIEMKKTICDKEIEHKHAMSDYRLEMEEKSRVAIDRVEKECKKEIGDKVPLEISRISTKSFSQFVSRLFCGECYAGTVVCCN